MRPNVAGAQHGLAGYIQEGRADHHLSVDEVAQRCGVPAEAIWRLLISVPPYRPAPSAQLVDRLADVLQRPAGLLHLAARRDAGGSQEPG